MQRIDTEKFINSVDYIINEYHLSNVSKNGYDYYGCCSSDGLSKYNRENYLKLRKNLNDNKNYDEEYFLKLYVLILYSFNNQIRFNKSGDFNLPPGKRDFNNRMREKLRNFLNIIHEQNAVFMNKNFVDINFNEFSENDFVYADPPYLITCASYNEQGGWTEKDEYELLDVLDGLTQRNIRFALSNVLEAKGKSNEILLKWVINRPNYRIIDLKYNYRNANYQRQKDRDKTREVLIVNY